MVSAKRSLSAYSFPPLVTIVSPADGSQFASGASVTFEGLADDVEDGDLSAGLAWSSSINGALGVGPNIFAALSDGQQFLGERFALFTLPSAGTLPFVQEKAGRERADPLILGDPETGNADLPRLAHAAQEAASVGDVVPLVTEQVEA